MLLPQYLQKKEGDRGKEERDLIVRRAGYMHYSDAHYTATITLVTILTHVRAKLILFNAMYNTGKNTTNHFPNVLKHEQKALIKL